MGNHMVLELCLTRMVENMREIRKMEFGMEKEQKLPLMEESM